MIPAFNNFSHRFVAFINSEVQNQFFRHFPKNMVFLEFDDSDHSLSINEHDFANYRNLTIGFDYR